jgi:hypothetical protein
VADRTDTEVAVDLLRAYAAGGNDWPGRPAICITVELIDQLEARYEAMRTVARRLNDGWRPGKNMAVVMAGSPRPDPVPVWMPPSLRQGSESMSDAERRALDELEADRA